RPLTAAQPRLIGRGERHLDAHLRGDLLDDAFDVEEVDRPLRVSPERSDRSVQYDRDAMMLADFLAFAMIRTPDFEQCTVARSVRAVEDDGIEHCRQQR